MKIEGTKVFITCRYFTKYLDLFRVPCQSSLVGIFTVCLEDLSGVVNIEFTDDIFSSKCLLLPDQANNNYIVMKLVHC